MGVWPGQEVNFSVVQSFSWRSATVLLPVIRIYKYGCRHRHRWTHAADWLVSNATCVFASFQTGEFSARFLLKLPVDFSNIPVYLLKVICHQTDILHKINIFFWDNLRLFHLHVCTCCLYWQWCVCVWVFVGVCGCVCMRERECMYTYSWGLRVD